LVLHKQDAFFKKEKYKKLKLPNSEFIVKNRFYLTSDLSLTLKELKFIKDAVIDIFK
tara:strand:+ start:415 stop:585 length:171 start_codon:yes stop_codon:yes gene_type:complete